MSEENVRAIKALLTDPTARECQNTVRVAVSEISKRWSATNRSGHAGSEAVRAPRPFL